MIVVRNVFRLKFGKAKEGVQLWTEGLALAKRLGFTGRSRILTDLTGPFYTVVFEIEFNSMADFEGSAKKIMGSPEWQALYQKVSAITESGHREIFNVAAE
jgi:hypothetical protein